MRHLPKKNEMETGNLPDKQFIVIVINMITELEIRTDKLNETQQRENIRKANQN